MQERQLSRLGEQHIDDDAFGGREQRCFDELLPFDTAAVTADELHPRAGQGDVEDARVRGVGQVETNDFARLCRERKLRLSVRQ